MFDDGFVTFDIREGQSRSLVVGWVLLVYLRAVEQDLIILTSFKRVLEANISV